MNLGPGTLRRGGRRRVARPSTSRRLSTTLAVVCVLFSPAAARADDAVLEWNAIAVNVTASQGPFVQARLLSITQLAVFEAVNAITDKYEPYLGTIVAPSRRVGRRRGHCRGAHGAQELPNAIPGGGSARRRSCDLAGRDPGRHRQNRRHRGR